MTSSTSSVAAASIAAGTGLSPVTGRRLDAGLAQRLDRDVHGVHGVLLGLRRGGVVAVVEGVPQVAEGGLVQRLDQGVVLGVGRDQEVTVTGSSPCSWATRLTSWLPSACSVTIRIVYTCPLPVRMRSGCQLGRSVPGARARRRCRIADPVRSPAL